MSLMVDSSRYRDIRFGDSKIDKVFLGSQLVWKRNSAPSVQLLSPAAKATGIAGTNYYATDKCCVLSWSGSDPDNDTLTYTCYLGTSIGTMAAVYTGTATSVSVNVKRGTTYYWKVTVEDSHGETGGGDDIRHFTTSANHLPTVTLTSPTAGATLNPSGSIIFKYTINDSDSPTDTLMSYVELLDSSGYALSNGSSAKVWGSGSKTVTLTYALTGGTAYKWRVVYTDDVKLNQPDTARNLKATLPMSFTTEGIVGLLPYSSSMPYGTTSVNYGGTSSESAKIWAFKHPDGSLAALIGAIRADNYDGWANVNTFSSSLACSKLFSTRKYVTGSYTGNIKASNLVTHLRSVSEDTFKPYYNGWTKGRYLTVRSPKGRYYGTAYGPYLLGDLSCCSLGVDEDAVLFGVSLKPGADNTNDGTKPPWYYSDQQDRYSTIVRSNSSLAIDFGKYLDTLGPTTQNKTVQVDRVLGNNPTALGSFIITSASSSIQPGTIRIQGRSSAGALGIFCITFYGSTTSVTPPSMSTLLDAFNSKYGSYQCWND